MEQAPQIAIVPTPGMGHLIPLVEFAKRLVQQHKFGVTFILPTDGPLSKAQKTYLDVLPAGMSYVLLPSVSFDDLAPDVKVETRICLTMTRSLPFLRNSVKNLLSTTTNLAALVVDLFGTDAFDVAFEFNVSPYIFFPSTAMCLSLFLHLPKLDQMISCEYRDVPDPIQIPGCIPIHGKDLLAPAQDRTNDAYKSLLHQAKRYRLAEGIILNSFKELEEGPLKFLQQQEDDKPPVYPVGPLIQTDSSNGNEAEEDYCECLQWLDDQPQGSVLFISFGSGGALSHNQLIELALGLEMSEQRFLWVIRSPNDKTANASYFKIQNHDDPLQFLPGGFLERTKGRCLMVPSWAPQVKILSHGSTGGFLTHCGWNSILESVVHGVPMIAWPLYAEQTMNAVMLTEDLKVAMRPKTDENGLIGRVEITNAVKSLMEGEEGKKARRTMKDLKDAASNVLSMDGASTKALSEFACKLKNNVST